MRKLVGLSLAVLTAIFFLLFILDAKEPPGQVEANTAKAPSDTHLGIRLAQIADFEGGKVAAVFGFLLAEGKGGKNVRVFCSDLPIGNDVLILNHQSVPGTDASLPRKLGEALLHKGMASRISGLEDALLSKDAILIAPTGAVPLLLAESERGLKDANIRVIVLESMAGKAIDSNGSVFALPENMAGAFERVRLEPLQEDEAVEKAARLAIVPSWAKLEEAQVSGGNFSAALLVNGSRAFCRAVFEGEGTLRFSDTGKMEAPKGALLGPSGIPAQGGGIFEFTLEQSDEDGRKLSFFSVLKNGGREAARQKMADGVLQGGWGSAFAINASEAGKCVVDVIDQFGRVHASAYFESLGFDIANGTREGNRYQFSVLFGGRPYSGEIDAWIDKGEKKRFYASNGTLVIWASPQSGTHTMNFGKGDFFGSYGFSTEGNTLLDTYVRLGVPALMFLAAVYFLLRAGRKVKYQITFPQAIRPPQKFIGVQARDIEAAWDEADRKMGGFGLAHYPEEIARGLPRALGDDGAKINAQSVLCALCGLVKEGRFCESEGMFVPSGRLGGFSASNLRVLRLVHDVLLERGVRFERKTCFPCGKKTEISIFSSKKGVLYRIGKRRRIVVFEGRHEAEEFERSLEEPSAENIRIKLARSLGKISFVPAEKAELEAQLL